MVDFDHLCARAATHVKGKAIREKENENTSLFENAGKKSMNVYKNVLTDWPLLDLSFDTIFLFSRLVSVLRILQRRAARGVRAKILSQRADRAAIEVKICVILYFVNEINVDVIITYVNASLTDQEFLDGMILISQ